MGKNIYFAKTKTNTFRPRPHECVFNVVSFFFLFFFFFLFPIPKGIHQRADFPSAMVDESIDQENDLR